MTVTSASTPAINELVSRLMAGPSEPGRLFGLPDTRYATLYARAAGLRNALDAATPVAGPEIRPVCLCTNDRTATTAALLAALAGGPSLVMPHAHSEAVLAELHRLTDFDLAIVDRDYPLPSGTRRIDVAALEYQDRDLASGRPLDPDAPWVHLFTGGSTGTPQLWTKTARNLLGESAYLQKAFAVSADDRVLTTSPPYHIFGLLYSVLVPLLANAGVVAATPAFPGELAAALKAVKPTILVTVPAYYRALKHHLAEKTSLRMAFSSASPLADADADAFSQATGAPIYDVYGSTETGGIASQCRAAGETGYAPFAGVDLEIHGERLWVRSDFLSLQLPVNDRGYFAAADRVADRRDGTFTVIGRADGIVKVGGKRVDLAEIRTRLLRLDGVRDALVFARPTATGRGNEILALVETDLESTVVGHALAAVLEPCARPRAIRVVSKMPVTRTGKYDRTAIKLLF